MIQINFKWILALISTLIPKSTQSELNIPVSQKYHNKYCETSISILVYYNDTIKDENNFPLNHSVCALSRKIVSFLAKFG